MASASASDSAKRKRSGNESPSITIPASKRPKGVSIKIKRKSAIGVGPPPSGTAVAGAKDASKAAQVREHGLKMWAAVRAARSKEGFEVAHDFLKLPPKRQYPDYYLHIKNPICLDDIKGRLDGGIYSSLKAVKDDLDLCFNNATTYNMEHSPIWESAKLMQRISHKEFKTLLQQQIDTDDEVEVEDDADEGQAVAGPSASYAAPNSDADDMGEEDDIDEEDEDDDVDEEDEYDEKQSASKKKRDNRSNPSNLLSARLHRLITKSPKDPEGTPLIEPFLVLPDRRDWPQYYSIIDKPIAFDTIQKKLKKRLYKSSNEFGADVELLFDNALKFNEDNTPVWLAAQTLRPIFHKLMSDLPPEHAYSRPAPSASSKPKIKLKGPAPKPETKVAPSSVAPTTSASTQASKAAVPLPQPTKVQFRAQPNAAASSSTPSTRKAVPPPTPKAYTTATPPPSTTPRPTSSTPIPTSSTHPAGQYGQTRPPPAPVIYQPITQSGPSRVGLGVSGVTTPPAPPRSPSPETSPSTIIKSVAVVATPSRRVIRLNGTPYNDESMAPVRCYAVRLGCNETSIQLKVAAEKSADVGEDEDSEAGAEDAKDESEPSVLVDGKKFPVEIKCNGTFVAPKAPTPLHSAAQRKASSEADAEGEEDGDYNDADAEGIPQINGHDGGEESTSEGDQAKNNPPATRATRSGLVRSPAKNGKVKRRKRTKRGGASRILVDLGQWDVLLNVGANVLDIKAGGKGGERWRLFVDRIL